MELFVGKYYTRHGTALALESGFLRKSQVFHNLIPLVIVHLLVGIAEPVFFGTQNATVFIR
jgi:hypothetical protein